MKILIITGGSTSERKISLISAKNVKEALEEAEHKVRLFDLKKGVNALKKNIKDFEVIFPVLHGEEGEGGDLQKLLSKLQVPFVGGDPKGFKKGWYKISAKRFFNKNNFPTSEWRIVKSKDDIFKFNFPSVLKSSTGGSSREVVILKSEADLKGSGVKKLLKSGNRLFVERFLRGVEVTVAILNNKALPVVEIIPPSGGWFDYKNKYSGETREIPHAPSIPSKIQKLAQIIAREIHQKLNLGHYSRIDFIVSGSIPYVLEINTIPGLTAQSLFPKAAQAVGISFPKLMDQLVKLAVKNGENQV